MVKGQQVWVRAGIVSPKYDKQRAVVSGVLPSGEVRLTLPDLGYRPFVVFPHDIINEDWTEGEL